MSLDEGRLTIRGERSQAEGVGVRRAERPQGRFVRSFTLPDAVEREQIVADYKDGVLLLHLPKRTEKKSARVRIEVK